MDINNLDYFKAITTQMNWLNDRQKILAENVANSDTPGYRSKDIARLDFSKFLDDGIGSRKTVRSDAHTLRTTHAAHLTGSSQGAEFKTNAKEIRTDYEASPSGNSVVIEEEIIKIGKTAENYGLMANAYKKGVSLLKMAITKSR